MVGQVTTTQEDSGTQITAKYSDIVITVDGPLKIVKLNRPKKMNAITAQVWNYHYIYF